jgi:hypothetical protein
MVKCTGGFSEATLYQTPSILRTYNEMQLYSIWFYIRLYVNVCRQPQTYVKPDAAISVFELLMMSGVSLKTC